MSLALSFVMAWSVTKVRFNPFVGSIALTHAIVLSDSNLCKRSIPDELLTAKVFAESFSQMLAKCIHLIIESESVEQLSIRVPHEWRNDIAKNPENHSGRVVYRFDYMFNAQPEGLWAIALPNVGQNIAVFLNGDLLGWGGSFEVPIARNSSNPQLFTISNGQFKSGANAIDILAVSYPPDHGFLGNVYIAPLEMLLPAHQRYTFFKQTVTGVIAVVLLISALLMLALWWRRPDESEYSWLALVILCWFIFALDQYIIKVPIGQANWDGMILMCRGVMCIAGVLAVHRFLNVQEKYHQIEQWVLITGGILALVILLVSWFSPTPLYKNIWSGLSVIGGGYIFSMILLETLKRNDNLSYLLGLSGGGVLTLALYDLLVIYQLRPLYEGFYFHYSAPIFLTALSAVMMQRFIVSLNETERSTAKLLQLNRELENRIDERGRFIAKSYETIFELRRKQALVKERARIMRDMHDGIGVYLNSILYQLKADKLDRHYLKESARCALDDLRLMIDSLGSVSGNVSAMLGMFRTRVSSTLEACNITLEWRVDELPELPNFGPEKSLNLLRLLQETVTNCIKHSNANVLSLSAYVQIDQNSLLYVVVELQDNGKGFLTDAPSKGNGLLNMSHRAKKINADMSIVSNERGTRVTIRLPVHED
ncbi:sensor histidine kinase [Leucothrix pacifica]|uniref:sensor histidine kinase n=1 Tax=Leucothrix pacifica TaxID=1247513 RepID=UPI0015E855FA|nr:ATP-binding protein [Leucothrix pacifica]